MAKDACKEPAGTCHTVGHGVHDSCLVLLLTRHCGGVDRSRLLLNVSQYAPCCAWWLLKGLPTELCWPRGSGRGKEGFHRVGLHCMHLQVQSYLPVELSPYTLQ